MQRCKRTGLHTPTKQSGLKLLIGSQAAQVNRRLTIERGRRRAVVRRAGFVARHRACHQSTVIAPIETDPRPALPRSLVLQVRSLVEDFVVVNAEGSSALAHGHT